jgi:hypothetical protein
LRIAVDGPKNPHGKCPWWVINGMEGRFDLDTIIAKLREFQELLGNEATTAPMEASNREKAKSFLDARYKCGACGNDQAEFEIGAIPMRSSRLRVVVFTCKRPGCGHIDFYSAQEIGVPG